jgi:hypothetical protein
MLLLIFPNLPFISRAVSLPNTLTETNHSNEEKQKLQEEISGDSYHGSLMGAYEWNKGLSGV